MIVSMLVNFVIILTAAGLTTALILSIMEDE